MRAAGHIEPLDSRAPTPGDANPLKILAAPREVLGVSMDSEPWGGGVENLIFKHSNATRMIL